MLFQNHKFHECDVELDGNQYEGCRFDECNLVYAGGPMPSLVGCSFGTFRFVFVGAAGNTITFLKALHGGGGEFTETVNDIIEDIADHSKTDVRGLAH